MNYLSRLTEDEARYVCSLIPHKHTISYLENNPKVLAKICPGFRAKAISKSSADNLLLNHRNRDSVSRFIETHISNWLSEIQEHIVQMMNEGDSKELAFLHTLPICFFADNIALFFKLTNEEYPEEYITLLSATVKELKKIKEFSYGRQKELKEELKIKESSVTKLQAELDSEKSKLERTRAKLDERAAEIETLEGNISNLEKLGAAFQEELKVKDSDVKKLQAEIESAKSELERTGTKLDERSAEIETLKRDLSELEKLRTAIQNDEEMIASLEGQIQAQEKNIHELEAELSDARDSNQQLEVHIRAELEKRQAAQIAERQLIQKPKCPSDLEEFKDNLEDNLKDIGVRTNSEYYALLKEHLSEILFQGIPIVVNRSVGITLMKCVANALMGVSNINTLVFDKNLIAQNINDFLSEDGRVVCLDNFIGNCNETELLPLFDNHRNKITFLTVAYDRTMRYVSEEFLRYCQYLNLNRIAALSINAELTEKPSTVEEIEVESQRILPDTRYSPLLRNMLDEFGFCQSLIEHKCVFVSNERSLCRILAFDVLPYCVDVLRIAPYNTSERFLKYAGNTGRCQYKNLFKEWFLRNA